MDAIYIDGLNHLKWFFTWPQFCYVSRWKYSNSSKTIASPPIFIRCVNHCEFVTSSEKTYYHFSYSLLNKPPIDYQSYGRDRDLLVGDVFIKSLTLIKPIFNNFQENELLGKLSNFGYMYVCKCMTILRVIEVFPGVHFPGNG